MTKPSATRTEAVKASGLPTSTAYREISKLRAGVPLALHKDANSSSVGRRKSLGISTDGSERWFKIADSLLRAHSDSRDSEKSFAEERNVSTEYEEELLCRLKQLAGTHFGKGFVPGRASGRSYPSRPDQRAKEALMTRLARAFDRLAAVQPALVQQAVDNYIHLVQSDDRLVLNHKPTEGGLRKILQFVQLLKVRDLSVDIHGFSRKEKEDTKKNEPVWYDMNDPICNYQAPLKEIKDQFYRLGMRPPKRLRCIKPKNPNSRGVLTQIVLNIQFGKHGRDAFRYVMAVAAITRFWRRYETPRQGGSLDVDKMEAVGVRIPPDPGRDSASISPINSVPPRPATDLHPVLMFCHRNEQGGGWKVIVSDCSEGNSFEREWPFKDDAGLVREAKQRRADPQKLQSVIQMGYGLIPLELDSAQYGRLRGAKKSGQQKAL